MIFCKCFSFLVIEFPFLVPSVLVIQFRIPFLFLLFLGFVCQFPLMETPLTTPGLITCLARDMIRFSPFCVAWVVLMCVLKLDEFLLVFAVCLSTAVICSILVDRRLKLVRADDFLNLKRADRTNFSFVQVFLQNLSLSYSNFQDISSKALKFHLVQTEVLLSTTLFMQFLLFDTDLRSI